MTSLYPEDLLAFARKFKFAGGRLRRVKLANRKGEDPTLELVLTARVNGMSLGDKADAVTLRLRFAGVEEYRFQKRPGTKSGRVPDCRFGSFQDLFFVTFDAWALSPGDVPKAHDFRASDAYVAARKVSWEKVEPK